MGEHPEYFIKRRMNLMENEIMENAIVEDDEVENEVVTYDEPYCSEKKGGALPLVGIALLGVAGAVGIVIHKNRAKLEERRIEKLRKKGYIITKVDVTDEDDSESEETEDLSE